MKSRPVLCLYFDAGAAAGDRLSLPGWDPLVARDLPSARALLADGDARVGLLFARPRGDLRQAELEAFLRDAAALQWIGVFEPQSLELPACRELILDLLFDHHHLPVEPARLAAALGHAHGRALLQAGAAEGPAARGAALGLIAGRSAACAMHVARIRRVAKVDAPVLISGESGSGKELAARAVHQVSARAAGPFVAVNCAAIQPSLIQAELFGYARGAFTGATKGKHGYIQSAHTGTILLDEIGDMPLDQQVNLLRFLQEGTITPVGSTESVAVDTRVIAATHVDLEQAVAAGSFREDLYYRLNVLALRVPALRECEGDAVLLAEHCFRRYARERSARLRGFSAGALRAIELHDWPGNVRELVNRVRRAMVMSDGRLISAADLGLGLSEAEAAPPAHQPLDQVRVQAERQAVLDGLAQTGRNITRTARLLGVSRMTLYRLMARHHIANPERQAGPPPTALHPAAPEPLPDGDLRGDGGDEDEDEDESDDAPEDDRTATR